MDSNTIGSHKQRRTTMVKGTAATAWVTKWLVDYINLPSASLGRKGLNVPKGFPFG